MEGGWWSQITFGFFFGIGFAVGTALIKGVIDLVASRKS